MGEGQWDGAGANPNGPLAWGKATAYPNALLGTLVFGEGFWKEKHQDTPKQTCGNQVEGVGK